MRNAFGPVEGGFPSLVKGAVPAAAVAGTRVLLVDDVLTTGATMDHCGRVLLEAGARSVLAAAAAS